jgi:hypothetical protein
VAPDPLGSLTLVERTNDGPDSLASTAGGAPAEDIRRLESAAPNHMQKSLSELATRLKDAP